jgi:MoaA/NifB/PqqE/SkfB family radical SAM enzyme
LWNNGVRAIVLSGGEPTLLPNLEAVLRHMKQLGFTVVLSTNGVLLGDQLPAIASYLDWLSLPLDAITQDGCRQLRTGCPDHASIIRDLIPVIRREHPRIRIKLGTVVCKANAETVAEVLEFLGPGALPDKWKLYEVSYSNYAILNRDLIDLSTESFDLVCTRAAEAAAHYGVILAIHRDSERNGKYLFVDPNGDLICIAGGHEVKVGNILSQCSDDELQTMLCGVNYRSNLDNFLTTFGIAHSGE